MPSSALTCLTRVLPHNRLSPCLRSVLFQSIKEEAEKQTFEGAPAAPAPTPAPAPPPPAVAAPPAVSAAP